MKKLIWIMLVILSVCFVVGKECQRVQQVEDIPCNIITSYHPTGNCNSYSVDIFNSSGVIMQSLIWQEYIPNCNVTFNITQQGVYIWNSTIETGSITVEAKDNMMSLALVLFLLAINLTVFLLPFMVRKFSPSKASDYLTRKLLWIAALLLLWFNTTIIRTMAQNQGMNIDDMLIFYWWIFTILVILSTLLICYFMVVGYLKHIKEATIKRRMGGDDA